MCMNALSGIGAAMQIFGKYDMMRQEAQAAKYQAEYNAKLSAQEADLHAKRGRMEIEKGIAERNRFVRMASKAQGDMQASFGASGFTMDGGTPLALLTNSAEEMQYDADLITHNSHLAAWEHRQAESSARHNSYLYKKEKSKAKIGLGSWLGLGATTLGTVGSLVKEYRDEKKDNREKPKQKWYN